MRETSLSYSPYSFIPYLLAIVLLTQHEVVLLKEAQSLQAALPNNYILLRFWKGVLFFRGTLHKGINVGEHQRQSALENIWDSASACVALQVNHSMNVAA